MSPSISEAERFVRGKRVLVTGSAGFVGSHLVARLVELGANVLGYDVNPTAGAPYIEADIRDGEAVTLATQGRSLVFHLAAFTGVDRTDPRPRDVMDINLTGTANALAAARNAGAERFVFASSSEVYGEANAVPTAERDQAIPVSMYGVSKLAGEEYCRAYLDQDGLPTVAVRLFNCYGPRQSDQYVLPRFVDLALRDQPPVIFGSGEQTRSFVHVSDVVNGFLLAVAETPAAFDVFNIGNSSEITMTALAKLVIHLSGRNLVPEHVPFGVGIRPLAREIRRRCPDISHAHEVLGYEPTVLIEDGVRDYVEWCRQQLANR